MMVLLFWMTLIALAQKKVSLIALEVDMEILIVVHTLQLYIVKVLTFPVKLQLIL